MASSSKFATFYIHHPWLCFNECAAIRPNHTFTAIVHTTYIRDASLDQWREPELPCHEEKNMRVGVAFSTYLFSRLLQNKSQGLYHLVALD